MTNEQLKGARKAQNEFPGLTFRMLTNGIQVGAVQVEITSGMSAEAVYRALRVAALGQS